VRIVGQQTVYRYVGASPLTNPNLATQTYSNGTLWQPVTFSNVLAGQNYATDTAKWRPVSALEGQDYLNPRLWQQVNLTDTPVSVQAFTQGSSIQTSGLLHVHASGAQAAVGLVHVRDDDGDVLERPIVRACVGRAGPASRSEELGQVQALGAQPDAHGMGAHPEHAREPLPALAGDLDLLLASEIQGARVEVCRADGVGDREANAADGLGDRLRRERGRRAAADGEGRQDRRGEQEVPREARHALE